MALTRERMRVVARLEKAEAELQRAIQERDGSPEARTRYVKAKNEHAIADGEARLLLTILRAVSGGG